MCVLSDDVVLSTGTALSGRRTGRPSKLHSTGHTFPALPAMLGKTPNRTHTLGVVSLGVVTWGLGVGVSSYRRLPNSNAKY